MQIINDGCIYFLFPTGISLESYNPIRLDPDTGEKEIIQEVTMFDDSEQRTIIGNYNIAEDWVYIYAKLLDEDYETIDEALFRTQKDGSGLERVSEPETEQCIEHNCSRPELKGFQFIKE